MNLGELRKHFKDNMNRTDLSDSLADFYLKSAMARCARRLRLPFQEVERELTVAADGTAEVPGDFLEMIDIAPKGGQSLDYVGLVEFRKSRNRNAYTRVRDRFMFRDPEITPGTKISLVYYADFLPVEAATDTNQLMVAAPDLVMLFACADACIYFVDDRQGDFEALGMQRLLELEEQAGQTTLRGGISIARAFDS